jgi:hypothetical protein
VSVSLRIGLAMIATVIVYASAEAWQPFQQVSGLVLIIVFLALIPRRNQP